MVADERGAETIRVVVYFHAELARFAPVPDGAEAPSGVARVELPAGSRVRDLLARLAVTSRRRIIVGRNGQTVDDEAVLQDGDRIDLVTPMVGGAPETATCEEENVPYGYWNRILHVDLTDGRIWTEEPGEAFYRRFLGGRSFIAHYLLREVPAGADPLGPENVLVFAAGVLTGTPVPGSGRHSVGAKSPLTGGFGEAEAGGFWGAELRNAGWDGIVVHGRAERPVYLWIKDDHVELRDAAHLWGRETGEVEDTLRAELGERFLRVAQTGIAGEHLVRYALVVNDLNEVAGRTGLGAVMGSKRLKAIAVRGTRRVPVADPTPFQATAKWVVQTMDEQHYRYHHFGTGAAMVGKQLEGHLIVRNFQDGQWTLEQVQAIDAQAIAARFREKMDGCYACSVRCKKRVRHEARGVEPRYGGPEYETLGAVGTNLTVDDLPLLLQVNQRLNQLGLDSISFGGTVAWAMECYERGLLTDADTGGIPLRWGDGETVLRLVDLVARREGPLGDLLAD
ncbi:MAG TPA: aldehyde ferredoxin oxidoreductase N-terminal domain-containing protein, partial [Chloroflexota bacterium]